MRKEFFQEGRDPNNTYKKDGNRLVHQLMFAAIDKHHHNSLDQDQKYTDGLEGGKRQRHNGEQKRQLELASPSTKDRKHIGDQEYADKCADQLCGANVVHCKM